MATNNVIGTIDDALCALEAINAIKLTITEFDTVPDKLSHRVDLVIADLQDWKRDYIEYLEDKD